MHSHLTYHSKGNFFADYKKKTLEERMKINILANLGVSQTPKIIGNRHY